ncbi:MAG: amino acid racemase [Thermomicrobiales bacterium]
MAIIRTVSDIDGTYGDELPGTNAYRPRTDEVGNAPSIDVPTKVSLSLPAEIRDEIIANALADLPNEACGLVAFAQNRPIKVFPGTNILQSPTRYRMADDEVVKAIEEIDQHGWRLGAIYHSHPSSPATPSDTDLDEANWPNTLMMIVSMAGDEPELRAFQIDREQRAFIEMTVNVVEPSAGPGRFVEVVGSVRRFLSRLLPDTGGFNTRPVASGAQSIDSGEPADRAVIGILGGMGPAATGDLFMKIISETPADVDQDHIPVVIYSDPRVPDRTDALLHDGEDPVPWLLRGARQLEALGASFIIIPCNTAHAFLDKVEPEITTPILSILETAADAIAESHPSARRVGLLATTGTIQSEIYQEALKRRGIEVVVPNEELMEHCVMPAIRAVKANNRHESVRSRLVEAAEYLEERGAHVVLAACTEIPVVLSDADITLPLVDATEELAKAAVREALDRDARSAAPPPLVAGGRFPSRS